MTNWRPNDLDYPEDRWPLHLRAARGERPPGLVAPVPVDPKGIDGPTRHQAAGPRYRQTSAGLYVPVEVDGSTVHQRILEQGSRVRRHGAVTGWASLAWRGAKYFSGFTADGEELPVPLVLGFGKLRPDPRVTISQAQLSPSEYRWIAGIRCTTVQRATFDEMRFAAGVRAAVVVLEKVVAARLITTHLMRRYVACRPAWTGVEQVRQALHLAVDHSRSPQETLMRLVWRLDAGLPPPLCNVPVFDCSGRLLGVPDLLDVEAGLYGEYDGEDHASSARRRADRARAERLGEAGLESFVVVGGELGNRPLVTTRMHHARLRALELSRPRGWTITPPGWWVPEEDLDHYLVRTGEAAYLVRT